MKKIIHIGMDNHPVEVFETVHVENFRVIYQYKNNNGKRIMLRATKDNPAYSPPHEFKQYPDYGKPICEQGKLYSIDILNRGYSGHHFEIVEA